MRVFAAICAVLALAAVSESYYIGGACSPCPAQGCNPGCLNMFRPGCNLCSSGGQSMGSYGSGLSLPMTGCGIGTSCGSHYGPGLAVPATSGLGMSPGLAMPATSGFAMSSGLGMTSGYGTSSGLILPTPGLGCATGGCQGLYGGGLSDPSMVSSDPAMGQAMSSSGAFGAQGYGYRHGY